MIALLKTAFVFLTANKKYAGILLIVAGFALSAYLGSSYQKAKCDAQLADFEAQMAIQVKQQKEDYEKRISTATSRLVLESRRADTARTERDNLLNRLRVANARISERADTDSAGIDRKQYAQCRRFLSEGAGLLAEGDDLARRIAREKDALADVVK